MFVAEITNVLHLVCDKVVAQKVQNQYQMLKKEFYDIFVQQNK